MHVSVNISIVYGHCEIVDIVIMQIHASSQDLVRLNITAGMAQLIPDSKKKRSHEVVKGSFVMATGMHGTTTCPLPM